MQTSVYFSLLDYSESGKYFTLKTAQLSYHINTFNKTLETDCTIIFLKHISHYK
jgi:hypothetical protein